MEECNWISIWLNTSVCQSHLIYTNSYMAVVIYMFRFDWQRRMLVAILTIYVINGNGEKYMCLAFTSFLYTALAVWNLASRNTNNNHSYIPIPLLLMTEATQGVWASLEHFFSTVGNMVLRSLEAVKSIIIISRNNSYPKNRQALTGIVCIFISDWFS